MGIKMRKIMLKLMRESVMTEVLVNLYPRPMRFNELKRNSNLSPRLRKLENLGLTSGSL